MKANKAGILALLVALSLSMGPVSAANWNVNANMNNSVIQGYIDGAAAGDTINFTINNGTTYTGDTGISLKVTKDNLTLLGNEVTLVGGGTSIFDITNRTGITIRDFFININSTGGDGITGSNVANSTIENNVITNGDDGINIFRGYNGLKIIGNTITNMTTGRDGISLVNHNNLTEEAFEALNDTLIEGNIIDDVQYGIFLGGNFKGLIKGNDVTGTIVGLNITGKPTANNGKLDAVIYDNYITGIAMECPQVYYLDILDNVIANLPGTNNSILTNGNFSKVSGGYIFVTDNDLVSSVSQAFIDATTYAAGNTGAGAYTKNSLWGFILWLLYGYFP